MKSTRQNTVGEKLLREYLTYLLEDTVGASTLADAGISAGDISAAAGPYGMAFGSKEDLKNTFITPFTDVFKTAVGKSKEITRKGRTVLTVGFAAILSTLIPGLSVRYSEIFKEEEKDIDKIKNEYKDVYERTSKALASTDAAFLAFMSAPDLALTAIAARKAPEVAKDTLSILTAGFSDVLFDELMEKNFLDPEDDEDYKHKTASRKKRASRRDTSLLKKTDKSDNKKTEAVELNLSLLKEISEEEASRKILTNKKFLRKSLENSPNLRDVQKISIQTYRRSLNEVYKQALGVLKNAKSVEEIEKIAGKKIPEAEKLRQLQGEERQSAEKMLIDTIRKSMKEFYIKNLQSQVDVVLKAGIPEEAQYVIDFKETIQKIKSL